MSTAEICGERARAGARPSSVSPAAHALAEATDDDDSLWIAGPTAVGLLAAAVAAAGIRAFVVRLRKKGRHDR